MNNALSQKELRGLLDEQSFPCLSLYQPMRRAFPDSDQNPVRFRNLLRDLERLLVEAGVGPEQCAHFLSPFHDLLADKDFWAHPGDGLAVLRTARSFRAVKLSCPVPELVVVSDSLHIKPLLRGLQSAGAFRILCVDRDKIRLLEGSPAGIAEIGLAPGVPRTLEDALGDQITPKDQTGFTNGRGDGPGVAGYAMRHGPGDKDEGIDRDRMRFFQIVDKAVYEFHARQDELPLILAALADNQGHFRAVSQNPHLLDEGIDGDPNALSAERLRERAAAIMQAREERRLLRLIDEFGESRARNLGTDELQQAGEAGANSRIRTLLVDADRHVHGRLDRDSGRVELADGDAPGTDDVLDELAELTLQRGGEVVVVPHERMPTDSGVAAIYRF